MVTDLRIALIGLRGSGKTTLGERLADSLGYRFVDSDREIVARAGMSIREIFARHGEPEFRRMEEAVIADWLRYERVVLSLGGGAVLSPRTRARLQSAARVVFLDARAEVLAARIAGDAASREQRPGLTRHESLVDELRELGAQRAELYRSVGHFRIDTSDRPIEALAEEVAAMLDEDARRAPQSR